MRLFRPSDHGPIHERSNRIACVPSLVQCNLMVNPSQLGTNNTCPTSTPTNRWRGNPPRSTPFSTPRGLRGLQQIVNRSIARRGPEVSRPTSRRSRWRSTSFEILSISSGWMWSPRVVNDVVPTVACSTYEMATRDAEASAKYHTERRRSSVEYIRRKSEERKDRRSGACCEGQARSGRNERGTTSRKLQRSDGVRGRSSNDRTLEGKGTKGIVRSTCPLSGDGRPARLLGTSVWASDVSENWLCDRTNCLLTRVHVRLRSLCGLGGSYWT